MVRLTRIYTRTGDGGETRLADLSVARKNDPRVAATGDVDEANSHLGVALALGSLPEPVAELLRHVQNELFDVGADLSTPLRPDPEWEPLRVTAEYVDGLEAACDAFGDPLPDLTSFILPGGSPAAAQLHVARAVVRRSERHAWAAVEAYGSEPVADRDVPGGVHLTALRYLNRLSDLLFILTRVANGADGDVLWRPGSERRTRPERRRAGRGRTGEPSTDRSDTETSTTSTTQAATRTTQTETTQTEKETPA